MKKPLLVYQIVICLVILTIATIPVFITRHLDPEISHYYKIERLNVDGKVQQTYISKGRFPWTGEHSVTFTEYPCGHFITINSNYTVEDLGTKLDAL
jgi:hypothetical protein